MKTMAFLSIPAFVALFTSCQSDDDQPQVATHPCKLAEVVGERTFKMGFSTWPYAATFEAIDSTYSFIAHNGDLISEQEDDAIPWSAWINGTPLPKDFENGINYRASLRPPGHELLLSVSILNILRSDLIEDIDGAIPAYTAMNDAHIEDAYFLHVEYLIGKFNPDYLLLAMECNQLYFRSPDKWQAYKALMANIRSRVATAHPDLPLSESFTLHDWAIPEPGSPEDFIEEITAYGSNFDFAAISFYPFLENFHTTADFQFAFDFLHSHVSKPVAFAETSHASEAVTIPNLQVNIAGNPCEQAQYLAFLLNQAQAQNYLFINWWCFADYDALLPLFPPETVDLGMAWLNTGLIDENGMKKSAMTTWRCGFEN